MNSHNHIMLGSVDAWFYRVLAGLNPLLPGWREIGIKPHPLGGLTSVEAGVKTVRGRAAVSWERDDAAFRLGFTVPAGSSARVEVPLVWTRARIRSEEKLLWDGSGPAEKHPDIVFVGIDDGRPVFRAESGTYLLEMSRT
jgi:alpha-L-rhamnosidase